MDDSQDLEGMESEVEGAAMMALPVDVEGSTCTCAALPEQDILNGDQDLSLTWNPPWNAFGKDTHRVRQAWVPPISEVVGPAFLDLGPQCRQLICMSIYSGMAPEVDIYQVRLGRTSQPWPRGPRALGPLGMNVLLRRTLSHSVAETGGSQPQAAADSAVAATVICLAHGSNT